MIRRKIKNVVKNFSEVEILVREATSNESWGPSNSILVKIAVLSSVDTNLIQIMPIIWKRLKDTGKKWRHVYKSLVLMEFLITRGNPSISDNCRQNIHFIQSLEEFKYEDNNIDVGNRIRKRAKTLVRLLKDNDLLRNERNKAAITDMRFSKAVVSQGSNVPIKYGNGVGSLSQGPSTGSFSSNTDINKGAEYIVPSNLLEEDIQLQIALAESQEDANQRKYHEEISELTDKYKIAMAVKSNIEENEFKKTFESPSKFEVWENEKVVQECPNDPWTPVEQHLRKTEDKLEFPVVNNPWSRIDASNDSLWSNSMKHDSVDPWSNSQSEDKNAWHPNSELVENPWSAISPSLTEYDDPWKDSSKMCTSISQNAITSNIECNAWVTSAVKSNPIPRKFNNQNKSDSVTNFLSSHGHLVDFDNLISMESLTPAQMNNNPFYGTSSTSCNPFLSVSSEKIPNYPIEVEWTSFETGRMDLGQDKQTSSISQNYSVKPNNLNPFLS